MSTLPLTHPAAPAVGERTNAPARAHPAPRAPLALGIALLLLVLYAAFSHGAVGSATEARVQVAVAVVAVLAAAAGLWFGSLRLPRVRLASAAVVLLGAFAIWSGLSLLWSVAPDQTWIELNRSITYVVVLCLALALGASHPRPRQLVAGGFLLVALAVTIYALAQKLFPGVHIRGLFDLNQTGLIPRLQEPLGYWNALALFIAMGVPAALAIVSDQQRTQRWRLTALVALELMILTLFLTYSRGGILALAVGLAVGIALSPSRLRSLLWLAIACVAAALPLLVGLGNYALTTAGVGLAARETAGLSLAITLVVFAVILVIRARKLLAREHALDSDPQFRRRVAIGLLSLVIGAVLIGGVLAAVSSHGLTGTISHAWKSFTSTRATSTYDPHRLLSAESENRWVWWKEAAGAFGDRPVAGWGAGSFQVVHLLYRRDTLSVRQPHSVPLQWLAETGIVGAALALVACVLLLVAAVSLVRRRSVPGERLLAGALLAAIVAYFVHTIYDWDWDIPGVTLPALLMLGVLIGSYGDPPAPRIPGLGPGPAARVFALCLVTLVACVFALSASLPSVAASRARSALVAAARGDLRGAGSAASTASNLDPLSDAGPRAQATIALQRKDYRRAREYILAAIGREPSDVQAWEALAAVDSLLRDFAEGTLAGQRALALDPRGLGSGTFAAVTATTSSLSDAPPQGSATATPLP